MAATEKQLYNSGASSVLYTDRRNFYVDPQVTKELWTDVAPFTTMISNQEQRKVPDPVFKMFEHRNPWARQYFQTSSSQAVAADNGADTWAVTSGSPVGMEGEGGDYAYNSWIGLECEVWSALTPGATKRGQASTMERKG